MIDTTRPTDAELRRELAEAALVSSLRTIDFPASRDDLVRVAMEDGLDQESIDALRSLPEHAYEGTFHVIRAIEQGAST
ncbi:DUF2795 domain-containing protein [Plantibacter sp. YIM 135249]|jgi:hypothetical protein|uniref:DUF2795 domain-containing protein n=1 Tax=Plantibacter sp. YIM 135249 TaxID=3423918 RepID=UPI003D32F072